MPLKGPGPQGGPQDLWGQALPLTCRLTCPGHSASQATPSLLESLSSLVHGPPSKTFSPTSPSSLCSWVVSAPLTFHAGVVTKRQGKEGRPPCGLGKGWLGQTGRLGALLWELRKGLPPEGVPTCRLLGTSPLPLLVQQALAAWSSTSPCREGPVAPSPTAPGPGGGRGRSRNVGSRGAAAWLMGQGGGSLPPGRPLPAPG